MVKVTDASTHAQTDRQCDDLIAQCILYFRQHKIPAISLTFLDMSRSHKYELFAKINVTEWHQRSWDGFSLLGQHKCHCLEV